MPIIDIKYDKILYAFGIAIIAVTIVKNFKEMDTAAKIKTHAYPDTVESILTDTVEVQLATPPPVK